MCHPFTSTGSCFHHDPLKSNLTTLVIDLSPRRTHGFPFAIFDIGQLSKSNTFPYERNEHVHKDQTLMDSGLQ